MFKNIIFLLSLILLLSGCNNNKKKDLFEYVSDSRSHITFSNNIIENDSVATGVCLNCFNGGGVGIGDFNNDGLPDIIFSGNQVSSKIYLNKGSLKI